MPAVATMTPREALALVAEEPETRTRSAQELRATAREWTSDADRKDRIALGRSKRRQVKANDEAARLRGSAHVLVLAAALVEHRQAATVEEALTLRCRFYSGLRTLTSALAPWMSRDRLSDRTKQEVADA